MLEAATNREGLDRTTRRFIKREVEMSGEERSFVKVSFVDVRLVTDLSSSTDKSLFPLGKVSSREILNEV